MKTVCTTWSIAQGEVYFQMIDLNDLLPADSGWTLTVARNENPNGWVVGYGVHNGKNRGFILMRQSGQQ